MEDGRTGDLLRTILRSNPQCQKYLAPRKLELAAAGWCRVVEDGAKTRQMDMPGQCAQMSLPVWDHRSR
jgi:hypothetical protein